MPFSIGIPELMVVLGALALLAITIGIAVLCWVWMKRSRASQSRVEAQNERIIQLLERQTELLEQSHGAPLTPVE
jgi:hypothetical protein